jgi:hypothetical protein
MLTESDVTAAFGYLMSRLEGLALKTANEFLTRLQQVEAGTIISSSFIVSDIYKSDAYILMNIVGYLMYKSGHNMSYDFNWTRVGEKDVITTVGDKKFSSGDEGRKYDVEFKCLLVSGQGLKIPDVDANTEPKNETT